MLLIYRLPYEAINMAITITFILESAKAHTGLWVTRIL